MTLFTKTDLFVAVDLVDGGKVVMTAVFCSGDEMFDAAADYHCSDDSDNLAELHGEFSITSAITDTIADSECDRDGNLNSRDAPKFAALKAEMLEAIAAIDQLTYADFD